ncbi:LacI family DNA-binding transcriptional regulator [Microbacterium excoecariae]|uniref:LacI family DNA-binding transcriptional regulator n=1 Tax=Microbacterium excoecariae TaxID=2715210 RepID=UPI00140CFCED|nr:LacI family DNA-binding transcriptional regulator [Microbacterium excoecariae]NHI16258.1 LacI family transcriptional regulator [Microbacterium excoecariae]
MGAKPPEVGTKRSRKNSTTRDVAALEGVSKPTASRAVLGQGGVSAETIHRVRHAIEQFDFVPIQIARSMTSTSSAILGPFLRRTRSPFYAHMAGAFEENAGAKGARSCRSLPATSRMKQTIALSR